MDIERAIEFLPSNQARTDARFDAKFDRPDERFARAERRFAQEEKGLDRLERLLAQNNRVVTRLTRYGVSFRSGVRRTERNLASVSEKLDKLALRSSGTEEKLNALIDVVDGHVRDKRRHE